MPADSFIKLLASQVTPEAFVQQGLRLLEQDCREKALLALAGWESAGLASSAWVPVAPELFVEIGALQRPSWGNWNGLLTALRKARTALLDRGDTDTRQRLDGARQLASVIGHLDVALEPIVVRGLKPLSDLVRSPLPAKPRLGQLSPPAIALRNRVVHDLPDDRVWWDQAAKALRPLLAIHARPDTTTLTEGNQRPAPWLLKEGDQVWSFNGTEKDFTPLYVSREGKTRHDPSRSQEVLLAFQRVLGAAGTQERDFKTLLMRLAPEEVKGVLFGDYLLGRQVGEGGFATVHLGRQLSTERKVAIKVLRGELGEESRRRFHQEAALLARLDHPNVVQVLGRGEETWSPPRHVPLEGEEWFQRFRRSSSVKSYIALEWVDGETLDAVFRRGGDRPGVLVLADWFVQAAEALAAVHAAGLIHRDVKPGNLMVTSEVKIKLMDFGIARTEDESRTLQTVTGQVLGTPAYMSPEQLRAEEAKSGVGPASDVYALCATFYELFTGARVFHHDTVDYGTVLTRKLAGEAPDPPRRLAPALPWEIETLLSGGLMGEPKDRPASAADLAADLRRFLANEPIRYKRASLGRRAQLFYRRHRPEVKLAAGFLILVALVSGTFLWLLHGEKERFTSQEGLTKREVEAKKKATALAETKTKEAKEKGEEAKAASLRKNRRDYIHDMNRLPEEWNKGESKTVQALLDKHRPERTGKEDLRGPEWYYWWSLCNQIAHHTFTHAGPVESVALSPDGNLLAVAWSLFPKGYSRVSIWDLNTEKEVAVVPTTAIVERLAFSPDSTRLAAASISSHHYGVMPPGGQVVMWEARTGTQFDLLQTPRGGKVKGLGFSPDGKFLACSWSGAPSRSMDSPFEGGLQAWNLATRKVAFAAKGNMDGDNLHFSQDGKQLRSLELEQHGIDKKIRCKLREWNVETGDEHVLGHIWTLAFTLNESLLQNNMQRFGHVGGFRPVALSPDRDALIVAAAGQAGFSETVMVFTENKTRPPVALGKELSQGSVMFSPDGSHVAFHSQRSVVTVFRIWDTVDRVQTYAGHTSSISALAFSADGKRLASGSRDQTARVWGVTRPQGWVAARPQLVQIALPGGFTKAKNGLLEARVSKEGEVTVWEATTKLPFQCRLPPHDMAGSVFALSADGKRLAVWRPNTLAVWDLTKGVRVIDYPVEGIVNLLALSPAGERLAADYSPVGKELEGIPAKGKVSLLRTWDAVSRRAPISSKETAMAVRFSTCIAHTADGCEVVAAREGMLVFYNAQTGERTREIDTGIKNVGQLAFSPDGQYLAVAGSDTQTGPVQQMLKIWNLRSMEEFTLRGHTGDITEVLFSPDSKRLASSAKHEKVPDRDIHKNEKARNIVRLWDVMMGEEVLAVNRDDVTIGDLFGPTARRLVELANQGAKPK